MIIYRNGEPLLELEIDNRTVVNRRLMVENTLTLRYTGSEPLDIAIGDYVVVEGETYRLLELPLFQKSEQYDYNALFHGSLHWLEEMIVLDEGNDHFYYFGTLSDHLDFVLSQISHWDSGWSVVKPASSAAPKNINYAGLTCLGMLQRLADKEEGFGIEFDIEGKAIYVGSEIKNETAISFEYGHGKGLYQLTRGKLSGEKVVTRLYGYGSKVNSLDNKRLSFSPGYVELNVDRYGLKPGRALFEHIFPRRNGKLTSSAVAVTEGSALWKVVDDTLDFDLNEQIVENAQIVFTTGDCAGVSFEIAAYDHASRKVTFREYVDESWGPAYILPSSVRYPRSGDDYHFVNIIMPSSYQEAAALELEQATAEALALRSVPQHPYTVECDPRHFKAMNYTPSVGDLARVIDTATGLDAKIRITGLSYPVIDRFAISLTLSDKIPVPLSVLQDKKIESNQGKIEVVNRTVDRSAKEQQKALSELSDYLLDPDGNFDVSKLSARSIEARMLALGLVAQNFSLSGLRVLPNYNDQASTIRVTSGELSHHEIERPGGGSTWTITGATLSAASNDKPYYLAAVVSKAVPTGFLALFDTEHPVDYLEDSWVLNIGVLYPQRTGETFRDFVTTYGMVQTVGDQIYGGIIQALDGYNFINLRPDALGGRFRLGKNGVSSIDFGVTEEDTLSLNNVKLKIGPGSTGVANLTDFSEATEQIAAAAATTAVTSLEIGGRNLILNSGKVYLDKLANGNEYGNPIVTYNFELDIDEEKDFIFSFDLDLKYGSTNPIIRVYHTGAAGNIKPVGSRSISLSSLVAGYNIGDIVSGRVSTPIKLRGIEGSSSGNRISFYTTHGTGNFFRLSNFKLEKGNKATDWSPAPEDVEASIETAKTEAENAAQAYADIKAEAERVLAEAYADGIVSDEEQARIDDVNDKLALAKEYAEAQDALLKTQQEAYADGKISTAEQAAIQAAKDYADLKKTEAEAYADGIVSDEEARAIADALEKYNAAKAHADAQDGLLQAQIDEAKLDTQNAQSTANTARNEVNNLNTYVDGAFKDGVISEAEAKAIEKYKNSINESMAKAEASFAKVFANTYLEGAAKIALENAKINLWGQRDTLLTTINNAIADGKTTIAEKNAVDSAFTTFNNLMSAFQSALEEANKAIQAKLDAISKGYVNELEIGGRNLLLNTKSERSGTYSMSPTYILTEKPIVGESYTLSGWFKFPEGKLKRIMAYNSGGRVSLFAWTNSAWGYEEWFYFSRTFTWRNESGSYSANDTSVYIYGGASDGLLSYAKLIKLEKGNKATDWTPAPEDVEASIETAKTEAENAAQAYADTKAEAERVLAEAYADGIVTAEEQARIDDVNDKLAAAKAYAEAQDALLKTQQEAYADGKISTAEQAAINAAKAYADLKKTEAEAYADGIVSDEEARAIADALAKYNAAKAHAEQLVDNLEIGGRNYLMNTNDGKTVFIKNGAASVGSYNKVVFNGTGRTPYGSMTPFYSNDFDPDKTITFSLEYKASTTVSGYFQLQFRPSKYLNIHISDTNGEWVKASVTSSANVDMASSYLYLYGIASSSAVNVVEYRNLKIEYGTKATDWSPALEDVQADINLAVDAAQDAIEAIIELSDSLDDFDTYIDGAFQDGIIEKAEAKAIEKYINQVGAEKSSIDASFTALYSNTYLKGTPKSNLNSAKTALNTAYSNLIDSINTAIADGKTTAIEKADVDSKFTAYRTAIATFSQRVEEAHKAIDDELKGYSDTAKQTADDAKTAADDALQAATQAKVQTELAKILGFASYEAMVTAATEGHTIIDGGHIKTELIDTINLITQRLVTTDATSHKKIIVDNQEISIFDALGDLRLKISGDPLSPPSSTPESFNLYPQQQMFMVEEEGHAQFSETLTIATIQPSQSNNTIIIPPIELSMVAHGGHLQDLVVGTIILRVGHIALGAFQVRSDQPHPGPYVSQAQPVSLPTTPTNLTVQFTADVEIVKGFQGFELHMAATPTVSTALIEYSEKRLEFSSDGYRAMAATDQYFQVLYGTSEQPFEVSGRGTFNLPGVLLAGSVNNNGGFSTAWGAKQHLSLAALRNSIGFYTVYHSIGHASYSVQVTPRSQRTCYIGNKAEDHFVVYFHTTSSSPGLADTAFEFVILGAN